MSLLNDVEVDEQIVSSGWTREGKALVRTRGYGSFAAAMKFVNAVAVLAEEADHHPDIDIRWDTVTLRFTTHSLGGITQADIDMAHAVDRLG